MRNTQIKSKQKENDGVSYFLFLNVALKQHTSFQLVLTMQLLRNAAVMLIRKVQRIAVL